MDVKVCCISSVEEAEIALELGASALGLVSRMPSGPGVISELLIAEIAALIGRRARSVLLTSLDKPDLIADQFERCGVNGLQLCEWLSDPDRRLLRSRLPEAFIMQVIHVTGPEALDRADSSQAVVDAILLDSGTLTGAVRELGGTGRTHDWSISRLIRESVDVPIFLAGGLRPSNVREAVEAVKPFGLDVCSGVRDDGRLDRSKLAAFMDAAQGASRSSA